MVVYLYTKGARMNERKILKRMTIKKELLKQLAAQNSSEERRAKIVKLMKAITASIQKLERMS